MTPIQRLTHRFAATHQLENSLQEVGTLLREFSSLVDQAKEVENSGYTLKDLYSQEGDLEHKKMIRHLFTQVGRHSDTVFYSFNPSIPDICLSLIQGDSLKASHRTKIEKIFKYWSTKNRPKSTPIEKAIPVYLKRVEEIQEQYNTLKQIVDTTVESPKDKVLKVGSFTLINGGGFSENEMRSVQELVLKGEALVRSKGFASICYGDITVTTKIHKSYVAFYRIDVDDIFILTKTKYSKDNLRDFIHELGHRLHHRFLRSKEQAIQDLYKKHKSGYSEGSNSLPQIGEELIYKGEVLVVEKVNSDREEITFSFKDDLSVKLKLPTTVWNGSSKSDFVTKYAGKSPAENLAELFSFYCLDQLSARHKADFESLL